jgi:hypothetical protein
VDDGDDEEDERLQLPRVKDRIRQKPKIITGYFIFTPIEQDVLEKSNYGTLPNVLERVNILSVIHKEIVFTIFSKLYNF